MLSQTVTTLTLDSIERFRSSLYASGKSDQTCKAYSTDLRVCLAELGETAIPQEDFDEVAMNWLTGNRRKVAAKTTGRRLTSLKKFAKWARWETPGLDDYSAPTPLKGIPHPLPEGMAGVRRMIEVASQERHKALVALCGMCGLRVAEALAVRPSHIDIPNKVLTVYGKGEKERQVPISTEAWEILQRPVLRAFATDSEVIGLKDRFARRVITNLGERAGLRRSVASHDLRATFATAVYDKTLDQRLVQDLLGHSNGTTTEIYIERSSTQKSEGVEGL